MKLKITNNSRAAQGVHCVDGLKFIDPGKTVRLDVADAYVERVRALPFLTIGDEDNLAKQASELGIIVDKRWSEKRLQDEIDKALAK